MADNATATVATAAEATPATGTETTPAAEQPKAETKQESPLTAEAIEKIIQSRVDKITAQLGKEKAAAEKQIEQMKKDKMSADELAKYEIEQERKALEAQKKELADKANRLTGINALTQVGLYDGSETAASLLDMVVVGATEDSDITNRVTAVKSIIDKLVSDRVSQTFKENGRVPNGGSNSGGEAKKENNIAEEIGKRAAETAKKSNDILNYYYGGKK